MLKVKKALLVPMKLTRWALGLDEKVELLLDNCPLGFDITEAGRIPVDKVEKSIRATEITNGVLDSLS